MPLNRRTGRSFVLGILMAAGMTASACASESDAPANIPIAVATSGPTLAAPTAASSGTAPTGSNTATVTTEAAPPTAAASPSASVVVASPAAGATSASQPTTAAPRASSVALTFRAANLAFDRTAVRVPVGATITATLHNDDAGQEHNLTFGLPGLPHGDTCKGPCTATQVFKVETAGAYFFLCTIHDMSGTFTVDP